MDLIVRQALRRGETAPRDIAIDAGTIAAVEPSVSGRASREIDARGRLVTPPLVNPHVHLDKALLGDVMRPNRSQTLQEAIVGHGIAVVPEGARVFPEMTVV